MVFLSLAMAPMVFLSLATAPMVFLSHAMAPMVYKTNYHVIFICQAVLYLYG